jgi:hypothetical protein
MASHGSLTLAQEAIGTRDECASTNSDRGTMMLITAGLCLAATGIVAVSLESIGTALVLFGIAGLLIRFA